MQIIAAAERIERHFNLSRAEARAVMEELT